MTITREDLDAGRVDFSELGDGVGEPLPPCHPGEHLADFLADYGWSARELARRLHVPHNRVLALLKGERALSADTALRLARLFGTSVELWLRLQMRYDVERTRLEEATRIAAEVEPVDRAAA
jgi:addiction module HigA family antidote